MKNEKEARWKAGAALVAAGITMLVLGTLSTIGRGVPPVTEVRLTAERILVLPFAVSRWLDIVGWAAWASFLVKFFLRLKKERKTGDPWLVGVGFVAFAVPGAGLYFVCGLAWLSVLAAVSGAVLGILLGAIMKSDDLSAFFRGWYEDGGIIVGPGLGIGVSFPCGTAVGLTFGILAGFIASLAYGAALLLVFAAKRIFRRG